MRELSMQSGIRQRFLLKRRLLLLRQVAVTLNTLIFTPLVVGIGIVFGRWGMSGVSTRQGGEGGERMRREHALSREGRVVVMEGETQEHCGKEGKTKGRIGSSGEGR